MSPFGTKVNPLTRRETFSRVVAVKESDGEADNQVLEDDNPEEIKSVLKAFLRNIHDGKFWTISRLIVGKL